MTVKETNALIGKSTHKARIQNMMEVHEISPERINVIINQMKFYFDVDEVMLDLINPWLEYVNKKNREKTPASIDFKREDVNTFFWFAQQEFGPEYLEKSDIYDTIKPIKETQDFIKKLVQMGFGERMAIITATTNPAHTEGKKKLIKEHFPEMDLGLYMTGSAKHLLDYTNAFLFDDGGHNLLAAVETDPFAHGMMLDYPHNQHYEVGKRIKRIKNIDDFFDYMPLVAVINHLRMKRTDLWEEKMSRSISPKIDSGQMDAKPIQPMVSTKSQSSKKHQ